MSHQQLQALFSNPDKLRNLLSRKVRYLGEEYCISDILIEDNMLILSSHSNDAVQDDCYGRAHRMVPKQQRLRFRNNDGKPTAIWEEIIFLDGAL
ncbi:MAG: hypothetical protein Q9N67_04200 [Ghiorsea sp.]|nr:hypothetical protein [Ghiorsea sp.]